MAPWEEYLKKIYFDVSHAGSFYGPQKLYKVVKDDGKFNISMHKIWKFLHDQESYSLHKPISRRFTRNHVIRAGIDDLWMADLIDMVKYAEWNEGYKYILVVIYTFSKYVWLRPLKQKTGHEVTEAFKDILSNTDRKPKRLTTDKGIEPMGLFWSLKCTTGPHKSARLVKKDVCTPMVFNIKAFAGRKIDSKLLDSPLVETRVQRLYKKPSVRRIPITGRFKGTIFLPEGDGPFPGLIDMFGGIVSLVETRAALLASHGYATMALSYLYGEGLPQMLMSTDFNYIKEAYEWFIEQDYIDKSRLGAVGLCFGGFLSLALASVLPQIRAVVNVNGATLTAEENCIVCESPAWLKKEKVYNTDEGIVIANVFDCDNPWFVPAWQHGAKVLVIVGEDDKQVHPKWHTFFYEQCPPHFKQNIQIHRYPGAGHMIEPPYSLHSRAVTPGRKRMKSINFISEKFYDEAMVVGGWPEQHAFAQEDSWNKILNFLEQNVKNPS